MQRSADPRRRLQLHHLSFFGVCHCAIFAKRRRHLNLDGLEAPIGIYARNSAAILAAGHAALGLSSAYRKPLVRWWRVRFEREGVTIG